MKNEYFRKEAAMQCVMYEKHRTLKETEAECAELKIEADHLRWKKNHADIVRKRVANDSYEIEEGLARAETLFTLYKQELSYPLVGRCQQSILHSRFLVSCDPRELFLPIGILQKMPEEICGAYERAVACGIFSYFSVMANVGAQDYILLAWRKESPLAMALVARWGERFASWDEMIDGWIERRRLFPPSVTSLLAGIVCAAGTWAYLYEMGFLFLADHRAIAAFFLGFAGTRLGYYAHDSVLRKRILSPFGK